MKRQVSVILIAASSLFIALRAEAQTVHVNQAGYLPGRQKLVYFSRATDEFKVVDTGEGAAVFSGKAVLLASGDTSTGLDMYVGDFSSLSKEGTYRVVAKNGDSSAPFVVSPRAFSDAFAKSLKGFYFQRCGVELKSPHAGPYVHGACHLKDAAFHPSTGRTGKQAAVGGWHDAGDYGKYVVNAGITVGTLLLAFERFPAKFAADDLGLPESGNKVPDLLDEVRGELKWLLAMQDPADGGVWSKATTERFDAFEMPTDDVAPRYLYRKSSAATGDFAAVTAMAARVYRAHDRAFAAACRAAAEKAWTWLEANPEIVPKGGFRNPPGTDTGEYGDGNDSDERLWAAVELYLTTGGGAYHAFFKKHWAEGGVIGYTMGWQDVRTLAQLEYLVNPRPDSDAAAVTALGNALEKRCAALSVIAADDGFHVALKPLEYYWGSNSVALNNAVLLILGFERTGNGEWRDAALNQLNYVLGCNMHDMSFVTGVGTRSPLRIHHRPSGADGIAAPVPGLLAGGPNRNREDNALKAFFSATSPPAACYVDNQASYASNEICINWNAPLVFVAGYFNDAAGAPAQ